MKRVFIIASGTRGGMGKNKKRGPTKGSGVSLDFLGVISDLFSFEGVFGGIYQFSPPLFSFFRGELNRKVSKFFIGISGAIIHQGFSFHFFLESYSFCCLFCWSFCCLSCCVCSLSGIIFIDFIRFYSATCLRFVRYFNIFLPFVSFF